MKFQDKKVKRLFLATKVSDLLDEKKFWTLVWKSMLNINAVKSLEQATGGDIPIQYMKYTRKAACSLWYEMYTN